MRTGQGAGASECGGRGAALGAGMGSVAAAAVAVTAVGISLDIFFDFDFLVFLGRALTYIGIGVPFDSGPATFGAGLMSLLRASAVARKFSARRTASLRPSGCGSMANRVQTLGVPLGVNRDELGRAPWGRG